MFYPDEIIEEVRNQNDIVDVISEYVKLQKKGANYFGLCPFHNEKSPSFSVSPGKQMYYCFGCGEGGNVISFVMKYENYSFIEAVQMLAFRAGIELPQVTRSKEEKENADKRSQILTINTLAAKFYYYMLKSEKGALAYHYLRGRELSDNTITGFGLGYSDKYSDSLYKYMKSKGYKDDILKETGLFTFEEKGVHDKFWNRVMFPIMDVNNKVIAFGGRVMGDGKPKYLNSPETKVFDKSRNLYGLNIARTSRKDYLLICEGYMDVISLHQAGFNNAVAALGTSFTSGHASLIKRYAKEVVLTFDSDGAGIKAALRAIPILREAGLSIKVLSMKPYKDPDEFIKALGPEAYEERIEKATNYFIFQVGTLMNEYNLDDPSEKTEFHNKVADMLLEFEDEIERNNYLESVCRTFNIPLDGLRQLVKKKGLNYIGKKQREEKETIKSGNKEKEEAVVLAQQILLTWLIEEKNIFESVAKYVSPSDFSDDFYKRVAGIFWAQMEENEANPAKIIDNFQDEDEHKKVAALFNSPLINQNLTMQEKEKAVNDAVILIKKKSLDDRAKNATDISEMQNIIQAKAQLGKIHITLN
ncbi:MULTISPECIES: DNA primase [unclassified Eubacterium (in: firmicutes)]|uniref:DNA primase n=1 Tax=unclassified Eubacterium (in: firmicutes) TaxID=2624479 RepID=UPI000E4F05C3|nr:MULTISPECIES: DNA primase [unclassified Eubacterium (in: firmicutes)]RGG66522.1 DNA primase [Eubacterium sp. AF17-7]RHR32183.1 DNA primase [Eubacterium sp. AF19-12LB]